jgi:cellulose synthase/poly-beta-1,6-N-acetylglucosamine synthase-like glycosyltransferase
MIFSLTLLFIVLLYGLSEFFFSKLLGKETNLVKDFEPTVSVVVAARNEATNLPACIESLVALDYPKEKLEIIIVNDFSTDSSKEILETFQHDHSFIKVIHLREKKERPGKAGALLKGIEKSASEIIFVTDADCQVPQAWIKTILQMFDERTGLSGGFTFVHTKQNKHSNWWLASQTLELMFLQAVAFSCARLNRPVSWLGNNIAFRRSAYDEVGGFRNLSETLVEDYALISAIRRHTNWQARFSFKLDAVVKSQPVENLKNLYNQRKRWASDRKNVPLDGLLIMVLNYLTRSLLLLSFFIMPIYFAILLMLSVVVFDLLFLKRISRIFGKQQLLKYIFGFEFVTILTTLIFPGLFLFDKKVTWKD